MKSILAVLFFSLFCVSGSTQGNINDKTTLPEANPETAGISPERLSKIDAMLKEAIADDEIPSAVALIARNGKIVFFNAYGMDDTETKNAVQKDDIFRIASMTKAITATGVMILWEEGKFQLDDPISKFIPEFGEAQIMDTFNEHDSTYTTKPAKNQITIRQLLTHTSGIGYGMIDSG